MKRLAHALLCLVTGAALAAEPECLTWSIAIGPGYTGASADDAYGAYIAATNAATDTSGTNYSVYTPNGCIVTGTSATCDSSAVRYAGAAGPTICTDIPGFCGEWSSSTLNATATGTPDDCPECEVPPGTREFSGGSSGSAPASLCLGGCAYERSGVSVQAGSQWGAGYSATGGGCSDPPEGITGANCITFSGGRICASKQKQNCGVFNGETMCADDVPDGGCAVGASGGALCEEGAEGAPDDGSSGPATPTATASNASGGTTNNYNYYNSSTVSSSTNPVVGPGTGGSDGGSDSSGDGDGEGEGECTEDECTGTLPEELEELDSFQEITQGFLDRLAAAPIIDAVTGVGDDMPTGTCPDWSFEVFDTTLSLSAPMCDIWENISGILSAAMLVVWGLLAARIVLTA